MFSGIQETAILLLIVFFIFIIPRFLGERNSNIALKSYSNKQIKLKYITRIFILGSAVWLLSFAICIEPWEKDRLVEYIVLGVTPVALFWGICWVRAGDR